MFDGCLLVLAALLSVAAMAWLALAIDVHWAQARQLSLTDSTPPRAALRGAALLALGLSFWVCLLVDRPSIAVLVWVMLLTSAALVVAFVLAYKPAIVSRAWPFI